MGTTETFIVYLAIHRLLIFVAGIVSITLGYRLLIRGLPVGVAGEEHTQSVEATFGNAKLSATNLAPGSLFALFGAVMIASVALYRPPEITLDRIDKENVHTSTSFRGVEQAAKGDATAAEALVLLEKGDRAAAGTMAAQVVQSSAAQWNNLAWVMSATGDHIDMAEALARAAVTAAPNNAQYLHTLATVQRSRGESEAALSNLRKAAKFDSEFKTMVTEWEAALRSK